jgi:hypothetical protein
MDIGRYGIWTFHLDLVPSERAIDHVSELDDLGFGAVWVPEAVGREAFTNATLLLRGGSDRLVDTIVAWGDMDTVLARVQAHHDAGADHVCVQVVQVVQDGLDVPLEAWRDLSAAVGLTAS